MTQLKLPALLAIELAWCVAPIGKGHFTTGFQADLDVFGITELVENRHTGEQGRWASHHELVIRTADGQLWRRLYERGLTEYQSVQPFENEGAVIPFDAVKPVPKTVIQYVPAK